MASLRPLLRAAPRAILRRSAIQRSRLLTLSARQSYAQPIQRPATDAKPAVHVEQASEDLADLGDDPNMNGNYPDPSLTSSLPVKRQHRDPYADWWDPIERRNYGEPVHEDNDILGVFSTEDYTHFTPAWGAVLLGCFVATVGALCVVVYYIYPDRPAAPRLFPGGLEKELGGPRAPRARESYDDVSPLQLDKWQSN